VTTVIYTNSLPPSVAVVFGGKTGMSVANNFLAILFSLLMNPRLIDNY
jgi:hypothetical protein